MRKNQRLSYLYLYYFTTLRLQRIVAVSGADKRYLLMVYILDFYFFLNMLQTDLLFFITSTLLNQRDPHIVLYH